MCVKQWSGKYQIALDVPSNKIFSKSDPEVLAESFPFHAIPIYAEYPNMLISL